MVRAQIWEWKRFRGVLCTLEVVIGGVLSRHTQHGPNYSHQENSKREVATIL